MAETQREVARAWILKNRGVLRSVATKACVSKSYVTMILKGDRGGQMREGSKRKKVEALLRKAEAPVAE